MVYEYVYMNIVFLCVYLYIVVGGVCGYVYAVHS